MPGRALLPSRRARSPGKLRRPFFGGARLDGGAVDRRIKDLLMLAGTPNAAVLRVQGQRALARMMGVTGRVNEAGVAALT